MLQTCRKTFRETVLSVLLAVGVITGVYIFLFSQKHVSRDDSVGAVGCGYWGAGCPVVVSWLFQRFLDLSVLFCDCKLTVLPLEGGSSSTCLRGCYHRNSLFI